MKNGLIYIVVFMSFIYCECDYTYGDANNDNALGV